jgi:tetratricopeptide (TPR) repeat protein
LFNLSVNGRRRHWPSELVKLSVAALALFLPSGISADSSSIQEAATLMERGNLSSAEAKARVAIDDPASRPVAYAILGAIRLRQAKYEESAHFLETALRLNPHLVGARLNLGNVYVLLGKSTQAEEVFRQVLNLDPGNFDARFALARLENEAGHFASSRDLAKPIIAKLNQTDEGLLLIASDDLALNDHDHLPAIEADWFALGHSDPAISLSLAQLFASHGLVKEAISVLEHSETAYGGSFDLYFSLAGYYLNQNESDKAVRYYKLALDLRQNCSSCLYQLARISEEQVNLDEALNYAIKAKQNASDDPDILFELGRICAKKDLYIDAINNLSAAVQLRPENESFQYVLASAYTGKKDYEHAVSIIKHLVSLHPGDPVLLYSLGAVQYLNSDLNSAQANLRLSIRRDPNQVASYYYLGLTLDRAGKTEEALQILQSLADHHPNHAATLAALGELLLRESRYSEARSMLEKATQLNPSSVKAHYQLGIALGRLGESDASKREFGIVRALNKEADEQNEMEIFSPDKPE